MQSKKMTLKIFFLHQAKICFNLDLFKRKKKLLIKLPTKKYYYYIVLATIKKLLNLYL
jgi:hypothetical protein